MLRLDSPSPDLLFDALLPEEAKLLPGELGRLDVLLGDPKLLDAFAEHWRKAGADGQVVAIDRGRPTIAMATYLRLMVLEHRSGFGYETLMQGPTLCTCDGSAGSRCRRRCPMSRRCAS